MNAVRRALAAAAVSGAALAGVGVAGVTAAQAASPVPAALSITAPARVTYGNAATVTGKLTTTGGHKALPGLTVALEERRPGTTAWTSAGTQTTAADGSVSFSVTPPRTEEFQLVHAATSGTKASTSATATIKVAYAVTASLTGNKVSVTVAPIAATQKVLLQRKGSSARQWSTLATRKLNKPSSATFTIKAPTAAGTYHYRVVKLAAHGFLAGVSATMTLTVP